MFAQHVHLVVLHAAVLRGLLPECLLLPQYPFEALLLLVLMVERVVELL